MTFSSHSLAAPTIDSFKIDDGSVYTNEWTVKLSILASGSPSTMRFASSRDGLSAVSSQSFNSNASFSLSGDQGLKEVWAQVADNAGALSTEAYSTIILDTYSPKFRLISSVPTVTNNPFFHIDLTTEVGSTVNVTLDAETFDPVVVTDPGGKFSKDFFLTDGTHTIRLEGADAAGNIAETRTITLTVDTIPPSLSITFPAQRSYVKSGTGGLPGYVLVKANASSETKQVDFYVDGVFKKTVSAAPFSFGWQTTGIENDWYAIKAKATDTASNYSTCQLILFLDNFKPRVKIPAHVIKSKKGGSIKFNLIECTAMKVKTTIRIKSGKKYLRTLITNKLLTARPDKGYANAVKWNGKDAKGKPLKPGKYTIEITLVDPAGNRVVWRGSLVCKQN